MAKPRSKPKAKARSAALPALVELANGGNAAAVKAIAKLATPESVRALIELLFESEVREHASQAIDRVGMKDIAVAEQLLAACHARPETCDDIVVLDRVAELALNHGKLANDPRLVGLLSRQLVVRRKPSAEVLALQESAVVFLAGTRHRESLPAIVGMLEQKDRESLWFNICDAVDAMGGTHTELAKLRTAVARANNETESDALEKSIAKLAKRLKA